MTSHLRFDILTLFPEMFPGPLGHSLPGKALTQNIWSLNVLDIRAATTDKHRTVDDTPYGGGAGMIMRPDIASDALKLAEQRFGKAQRRIYLSPRGKPLQQAMVQELAAAESILLFCGRYEGIDERVIAVEQLEEVSLGDFVLAGGELAAMSLIESCVRLLPGVLGNAATTGEESFTQDLLEYPHYTRPPVWEGQSVPEVLISGHHEKVRAWRRAESERITRTRRPDLWQRALAQQVTTQSSTGSAKEKAS
jgi:tRNA (guanine37-N1)-methyltransferase